MKEVSRQGCKQFWKTVKSLKKASSQIPTLKTDSIIASSNTAKASLLNDVFSQNFNTSTPPLTDIDYHRFMADPSSPYPEEIFCTEEDVFNLLLALDTSKASGSDGISGRMLKGTSHSIAPVLTNLFNLSIKTGKIPQKWKISSIVPIPKSQTNTDDPCNYRPISLLPVVSKLLERHMYSLVFAHLADIDLISDAQWGFTPGKSTITSLLSTFNDILQLLEHGADVALTFFDLRKAFDSVPHLPLLQKLKDIGLEQHILQWLTSYLSDRQQHVVVDGATSNASSVLSGVPQGSVLGPLLFLVYINCVSLVPLSEGSKISMYADNILLSKPINHPDNYDDLQRDIDAIQECICKCHLTLNPSKCKYLIASRRRQPHLPRTRLFIGRDVLELVDSYRYLGVLVTSKLSWADHINHICSKARKLVGMLYRQFYTWADTSTLLRIYLTCIRPHLEYACQLWDPYTDKGTQALESVQKFACKVCLKRWDVDYESMLQQLELTSLSQRRTFLKLTTMYNIINGTLYFPTGYFVQNYFPYSSSHGTLNYIRPFARTNYLYSSFVPSVISLWNNLPDSVKTSSISVFKAHIPH